MQTHGAIFENGGSFERPLRTATVVIPLLGTGTTAYVQVLPAGRAKQITRVWTHTIGAFSAHANTLDLQTDDGSTETAIITQYAANNIAANTNAQHEVADGFVESDERVQVKVVTHASGSLAVGCVVMVEYAEAVQ